MCELPDSPQNIDIAGDQDVECKYNSLGFQMRMLRSKLLSKDTPKNRKIIHLPLVHRPHHAAKHL